MKVYLASSWKNEKLVKEVKRQLEAEGNIVDAFCDPSGGRYVFSFDRLPDVSAKDARTVMEEPEVQYAFHEDKAWIDWSEAVVLILPAGKSAHLEAGYAKGQGKHLIIYQEEFPLGDFDVMYGFADLITDDLNGVAQYLRSNKVKIFGD